MTTYTPLVLTLADALDAIRIDPALCHHLAVPDVDASAAELRRLHAENEALREALQQIIDLPEDSRIHYKVARRALNKNGGTR